MTYTVCLSGVSEEVSKKIKEWTEEKYQDAFQFLSHYQPGDKVDIKVLHIQQPYDWIKANRLRKKLTCKYVLLLDENLLFTSPLAVRMKVETLLINPIRKGAFLRGWDKLIYSFEHSFPVLSDHNRENQLNSKKEWPTVNEPLETSLLRKIICKNQFSSEELIDTLAYFKENDFPNIVCFIQGFRHLDYRLEEKNQTIQLIRAYFEKTFQGVVPRLYFVPYRNYLLVLFRQTENVHSVSHWETGRMLFNQIVHELLTNHKIQIYIGVGTIYNDPLKLYLSCEEAKVARSFPPYRDISLRYYEEVTREPQIVKSMTYIEERLGEEISALEVARYVNLSYSYFVKLFKRETGKNFSGYVTFVRLRRAVWMLRNTDQTIEEISDEVGFNTPNYFSATFKKYIGITPSEFRLTTEILFS